MKLYLGLGEAVCTPACREILLKFDLEGFGKTEDLYAWAFLGLLQAKVLINSDLTQISA